MGNKIVTEYGTIDVDQGRKEADKFRESQGWDAETLRQLRVKCKKDLFFLCYSILGFKQISPNLHGDMITWMRVMIECLYRLLLLPRSHYKSTIFTTGDSIQLALTDDQGDEPYPRNLGPEVRLLLTHEKADAAKRFLFGITNHFTMNPRLMALFPECVPREGIDRINLSELQLPRNGLWPEPTFDTMGVGGKNQGRHYHIIKCDDIYGAEARDSKVERDKTLQWFDNLQSYLITPRTDHIDVTGTRWAFDDVYAHMMKTYGDQLKVYKRSCEEVGPDGKKRIIFPEQFTPESLAILKKNRVVWNAQYANDPSEGGAKFQEEWLRYYNWVGRDLQIFHGASDDTGSEIVKYESLDRICLVDPAMSGNAGIVITGTDPKKRVFCLHSIKQSWKPDELLNYIFQMMIRWRCRLLVMEYVLFSEVFGAWISREMQLRGYTFQIEGARTQQRAKEVRIDGLAGYFQASQIFFNASQSQIIEEFREYGASKDVHILDALAYGPKFWRAGVEYDAIRRRESAEEGLNSGWDSVAGYSEI